MHGCLFLFGAVEHLDTFGLYEGSTESSVHLQISPVVATVCFLTFQELERI